MSILQEGKARKFVPEVEQVTFSGREARRKGQDVTYVTERCVMKLGLDGIVVTEVAPGIDVERDVLGQTEFPLQVSPDLRLMDERLFRREPMGLTLPGPSDGRGVREEEGIHAE